ncbi:hypothetical protein [Clostridium merdae]|nr:hypothetical protein [Clostridium merdae]
MKDRVMCVSPENTGLNRNARRYPPEMAMAPTGGITPALCVHNSIMEEPV